MSRTTIMYLQRGGGLAPAGRIGRVRFSKTRKTIYYGGRRFQTLAGRGYKANYVEVATGEEYWISGCRRDGNDPLYSGIVEIDDDVREEYWIQVRRDADSVCQRSYRALGKHSR
ncbi:MAG: 1-deoxy-D-xylulose-5-phosphate synthase [Planctomycetota bacterium]